MTNNGRAAKYLPLAKTSNIMRKDKHGENEKGTVFKGILPGFDHLSDHKFPLDQYTSLVFLFALVRKIQEPGKSREEMSKPVIC